MVRNKLFNIQALKTVSIYLAHEFMFKYVSDLGWTHWQVWCQLAGIVGDTRPHVSYPPAGWPRHVLVEETEVQELPGLCWSSCLLPTRWLKRVTWPSPEPGHGKQPTRSGNGRVLVSNMPRGDDRETSDRPFGAISTVDAIITSIRLENNEVAPSLSTEFVSKSIFNLKNPVIFTLKQKWCLRNKRRLLCGWNEV